MNTISERTGEDAYWRDMMQFVAEARRAPKAEIRVPDMGAFVAWVEARIGPLKTDPKMPIAPAQFSGIPIIPDYRLPPNRAILLVDDEVQGIIDLDDRPK